MSQRPVSRPFSVPSGRASRLSHFGSLATGIAGNMAVNGVQELVQGRRPALRDLLLTPSNVSRFADQLARMRGAAMKMGQLISMDTGDVLPPELAQIMARLRDNADHMPPKQLKRVLTDNWGDGWLRRFERFDVHPVAAASIGQVHRAQTRDGRDLAIKVQYPGVRRSIDSDIDNVMSMVRMAGLIPDGMEIAPLLAEAKRQLHQEADYEREGAYLARFGTLLESEPDYVVPVQHPDLTTSDILSMSFMPGVAIETLETADQTTRDRVAGLLIRLVLREIFEFNVIQSDPNFANYRYDPDGGRIVLLDFGAAVEVDKTLVARYRKLLQAGMSKDHDALRQAAIDIGFFTQDTRADHADAVLNMMEIVFASLRRPGSYDFSSTEAVGMLRDAGMEMSQDREFNHIPPVETLFLHRKLAGIYLLAHRLRAKLDVRALIEPYL